MSTEIQKSTNEVATVTEAELSAHLKNMGLFKDLTEGEVNTFFQISKAYNLNPFKREIYVSKYNGQMSIIVGYESYIKRAERSGVLDGWEVKTEGTVAPILADSTLKAIITIYRKDRSRPFVWEAKFTEYMQLKDGRLNKFWQKSETMIKKVAMAQGFRLCFNDELGGMPYTKEEMPEQSTEDVSYTTVVEQPKEIAAPAKKKLTEAKYQQALSGVKSGATLPNSDVSFFTFLTTECELTTEQLDEVNAAYPL